MKIAGILIVLAVLGFFAWRKWPKMTLAAGAAIGAGAVAFWDSISSAGLW